MKTPSQRQKNGNVAINYDQLWQGVSQREITQMLGNVPKFADKHHSLTVFLALAQ